MLHVLHAPGGSHSEAAEHCVGSPSILWNLVKPVETIIPCQKAVVIELKSVKKNEDIGILMLIVLWMPSLYEHVSRFIFDEA